MAPQTVLKTVVSYGTMVRCHHPPPDLESAWVGSLNALERRGDPNKVRGSMPPFSAILDPTRVGSLNCLESSGDRKVNRSMRLGSASVPREVDI